MASTYEPIATTTISGTSTTTVTFSSITGSYTDLVLVSMSQSSTTGQDFKINLNSTTTGYSTTKLQGDGSVAFSGRRSSQSFWYFDETGQPTSGAFMTSIFNFQNYSNTNVYKTALWRNSAATLGVAAVVGLWQNTAAINQIEIGVTGGTIFAGSTFTLYGIKAA